MTTLLLYNIILFGSAFVWTGESYLTMLCASWLSGSLIAHGIIYLRAQRSKQ